MNRSVLVISAYLMIKYHWSLKKALEFIKTRKPNLEVKSQILEQLVHYESFLHRSNIKNPSYAWDEERYVVKNIFEKLDTVDNLKNEDFMLRNTYLNSLAAKEVSDHKKSKKKHLSVKWQDKGMNIKTQLEDINQEKNLEEQEHVYPVTAHVGIHSDDLKSALKKNKANVKSKFFYHNLLEQSKPKEVKATKENKLGKDAKNKSLTINTFEVEEESKRNI